MSYNPEAVEYSTGFTADEFDRPYILDRPARQTRAVTEAERWVRTASSGPWIITQKYDDVPPRFRTMPAIYYSHENIMRGVRPFSDGSIAVERGGRQAAYRSLGDYRQGRAVWRSHPRRSCQLWRVPKVHRYGIFTLRGRPINPRKP